MTELDIADPMTDSAAVSPPLRDMVLSGRYVGQEDDELADRFGAFLLGDPGRALAAWFGSDRIRQWVHDPDALHGALDRDITAVDAMLGEQIDAILHHSRLSRLEGSWRGLAWLVGGADLGARLKIKVLNASWPLICRDLDMASEFDQSNLFRKVYEEEFGSPGGEPYGILLIDHELRHRPDAAMRTDDVGALQALSQVAAAAFAPVILGAAPGLLEVDAFADLAKVIDITAPLRNAEHARWNGLSARPDMRFIGIVLPRLLARQPWRADGSRADGFHYNEYAPDHRVWMSATYAFGATVARSFANFGWPADVRGVDTDRVGGGLVQDTCQEPFRTDSGSAWGRVPLEIVWNDRQERDLLNAGLVPLASIPNCAELVFGTVRSMQVPIRYSGAQAVAANANARLSAQLNSMLCASRFAHYIKMVGRQMVGSYRTGDEIERDLQRWLVRYVNSNLSATGDSRARFPLVDGRVEVRENEGRPGSFGCIVRLQPHYQLDDVTATFQLVTHLGDR